MGISKDPQIVLDEHTNAKNKRFKFQSLNGFFKKYIYAKVFVNRTDKFKVTRNSNLEEVKSVVDDGYPKNLETLGSTEDKDTWICSIYPQKSKVLCAECKVKRLCDLTRNLLKVQKFVLISDVCISTRKFLNWFIFSILSSSVVLEKLSAQTRRLIRKIAMLEEKMSRATTNHRKLWSCFGQTRSRSLIACLSQFFSVCSQYSFAFWWSVFVLLWPNNCLGAKLVNCGSIVFTLKKNMNRSILRGVAWLYL